MAASNAVAVASTVARYPRLPYTDMKNDVLGTSYMLSLVFVGSARAARLNREYRAKTYTPNVLSFPLDQNHGEIYICVPVAAREAARHGISTRGYIGFLFIHGLLHLKGMRHGDTMERAEQRYVEKYTLA